MKAYKVELLVLDLNNVGVNESTLLYDLEYLFPKVMSVQSKEIGEWDDDHPLNKGDTEFYNNLSTKQMTTNQIDSTTGLAINCHNCIHCSHSVLSPEYDICKKTGGDYCSLVHTYPSIYGNLCNNYSAWAPRQKTILELISDKIRKFISGNPNG
jgi:hypothetical protein